MAYPKNKRGIAYDTKDHSVITDPKLPQSGKASGQWRESIGFLGQIFFNLL
jgi:hypothetical protein